MSRLGADVDGLDAAAAEMTGMAAGIDSIRGSVDAALARTAWNGPDADAFRRRWRTIAVRDLDGFRGDLTDAAQELRRQAAQQRTTSGFATSIAAAGFLGRAVGGSLGAGGSAANHPRSRIAGDGVFVSWRDVAEGAGLLAAGGPLATPGGMTLPVGALAARWAIENPLSAVELTAEGLLTLAELSDVPASVASHSFLAGAGMVLSVGSAMIHAGFEQHARDVGGDHGSFESGMRITDAVVFNGTIVAGASVLGATFGGPIGGAIMSKGASMALDSQVGQSITAGHLEVRSAIRQEVAGMLTDPDWSPIDAIYNVHTTQMDAAKGTLDASVDTMNRFADATYPTAKAAIDAVGGAVDATTDAVDGAVDAASDMIDGATDAIRGWFP